MLEFLDKSEAHLAVSLHTPFDEERRKLMPIQQVYPLKEVLKEIRSWDFGRQRRVSFEYILFKGFNDSPAHINELSRILHGIRCRINLIRFHPIPDTPLESPDDPSSSILKTGLNERELPPPYGQAGGRISGRPADYFPLKNYEKSCLIAISDHFHHINPKNRMRWVLDLLMLFFPVNC